MTLRRLQGRLEQPFVKQGTIQDMTVIANKLAKIRAAAQQIKKSEEVMLSKRTGQREWQGEVAVMVDAAEKGQAWCEEAIGILNGIQRNAEGYMRELDNASD
jgi:hypothetical protein